MIARTLEEEDAKVAGAAFDALVAIVKVLRLRFCFVVFGFGLSIRADAFFYPLELWCRGGGSAPGSACQGDPDLPERDRRFAETRVRRYVCVFLDMNLCLHSGRRGAGEENDQDVEVDVVKEHEEVIDSVTDLIAAVRVLVFTFGSLFSIDLGSCFCSWLLHTAPNSVLHLRNSCPDCSSSSRYLIFFGSYLFVYHGCVQPERDDEDRAAGLGCIAEVAVPLGLRCVMGLLSVHMREQAQRWRLTCLSLCLWCSPAFKINL